ncbi:MAG: hypothetical protein V3S54_09285 [Woeseiaceae bacterium]
MARLKDWRGPGKSLALKSSLMIYVNRGALIAAWWPKKRGRPKSLITQEQNEWFRQANLLAKYADGQAQWMAIEVSKGSPWYPRDLHVSAMKGRLFETINIDGQEYRAVAVRDDVSSDLDFLAGTEVGTIIVRGSDLWQQLIPGPTGRVLTSFGPDALPQYLTPGGSDAKTLATAIPKTTFSSFAAATKGDLFKAQSTFQVHEMGTRINATVNHVYRGSIFRLDAAWKILEIVAETADIVSSGTFIQSYSAPLITPVVLTSATIYGIAWSRRDGADNFAFPLNLAVSGFPMIGLPAKHFDPLNDLLPVLSMAKAQPAVNDVFTATAQSGYYMTATITL